MLLKEAILQQPDDDMDFELEEESDDSDGDEKMKILKR